MRVGGGELPKGVEAPHKLQVLPPGNPRGVCGGGRSPPHHAMGATGGRVRVIVWLYWLIIGVEVFMFF